MLKPIVLGVMAFLAAAAVAVAVPARAADATPGCGGYNEAKCEFAPAVSSGEAQKLGCGSGQFIDPRKGGECWSCPKSYIRTLKAVTDKRACAKDLLFGPWSAAKYHRSVWGCPAGTFLDIGLGTCWSCPANHNRSIHPVTGPKACTVSAELTCDAGSQLEGDVCRVSLTGDVKAMALAKLSEILPLLKLARSFLLDLQDEASLSARVKAAPASGDTAVWQQLDQMPSHRTLTEATQAQGYGIETIGTAGDISVVVGLSAERGITRLMTDRSNPLYQREYTTLGWSIVAGAGASWAPMVSSTFLVKDLDGLRGDSQGIMISGELAVGGMVALWFAYPDKGDEGLFGRYLGWSFSFPTVGVGLEPIEYMRVRTSVADESGTLTPPLIE